MIPRDWDGPRLRESQRKLSGVPFVEYTQNMKTEGGKTRQRTVGANLFPLEQRQKRQQVLSEAWLPDKDHS